MTITELIDHLRKLRAKHGECWVENSNGITFSEDEINHKSDNGQLDVIVFETD